MLNLNSFLHEVQGNNTINFDGEKIGEKKRSHLFFILFFHSPSRFYSSLKNYAKSKKYI